MAEALRKQGRRREAAEIVTKALAITGDVPQLHAIRAEIAAEDGELAEAVEVFGPCVCQCYGQAESPMVITSLRDDRIVEANEAFTKLAGYERSEVVGKRASDIQLWANTELRQQVMEKVTQGIPVADFEAEFRARNGQTKVGLITVTPLRVEGEPCVLVMGRDITDRRNAEQQLRDRTGILNALIENNPLAIVVIDEGERIQLVNAAFESLFRYKRDEAIGKRLDDLIAPQDLREEAFGYSGSLLGGKR